MLQIRSGHLHEHKLPRPQWTLNTIYPMCPLCLALSDFTTGSFTGHMFIDALQCVGIYICVAW